MPIHVADEVFLATALLHREHPTRDAFTVHEIVTRAQRERLHDPLRPGVQIHASWHCVANKPPNPGTYKMLFATGRATRRLFRPGDRAHPGRTGKSLPNIADIPARYHELVEWVRTEYEERQNGVEPEQEPILVCGDSGAKSGAILIQMNMSGNSERAGVESRLLGHEPVIYLPERGDQLVTSAMTLGEVLVKPLLRIGRTSSISTSKRSYRRTCCSSLLIARAPEPTPACDSTRASGPPMLSNCPARPQRVATCSSLTTTG